MSETQYRIGEAGVPWGDAEKARWLSEQSVRRLYGERVLSRLQALPDTWESMQYGALSQDPDRYPLWACSSRPWRDELPSVLVTGGVHGYETSGVMGALRFLEAGVEPYRDHFNFLVLPCVSPWGFETINRWNPETLDPNRSFFPDTPAQEPAAVMALLDARGDTFLAHFDLHETTDSDNNEFRPAKAARDGEVLALWHIPDGFYTVGDVDRPEPDFQRAIIEAVEAVTPIAPPDPDGRLIGVPLEQHGVINYPVRNLYLCAGVTTATYVTTTEVYPDSPAVTDETCIQAQLAALRGGLNYILTRGG